MNTPIYVKTDINI